MANKIKIPHKAFGTFVRAANSWLASTVDAKTGLEVRLANQEGKLHVSAGADANYMEAVILTDPKDLEALTQPIFLDVPTLASYAFDSDNLTMVVPTNQPKEDQRINFSVPGFNFRVPRKEGAVWRRNHFDLAAQKVDGLILDKEGFEQLFKHLTLPNSFKTDRRDFQFCFEVNPGVGYRVYGYDGFGALCHMFKNKFMGKEGQMVFTEDFFLPCKEFLVDSYISFGVSGTQGFGEFKSESSGIEILRWTQPRYQKQPSAIPKALEDYRRHTLAHLMINPKEMAKNIQRACMFLSPTEMRATPMELYTIGPQYALVTKKSGGEGEVRAEGELVQEPAANLELNIQASCFKEYLDEFENRAAVSMEVLQKTVILSQNIEEKELLYWMPVMPRIGGGQ